MNRSRLPELVAEITDELVSLAQLIGDVGKTTSAARELSGGEGHIYVESVVLKLHGFYTGCERILERVSTDLNGGAPDTHDWYRRLVHSMTLAIEGVRPPVLSASTERALLEFLAFRHVVRNLYAYHLDRDRTLELGERARAAFEGFDSDVRSFLKVLQQLAD